MGQAVCIQNMASQSTARQKMSTRFGLRSASARVHTAQPPHFLHPSPHNPAALACLVQRALCRTADVQQQRQLSQEVQRTLQTVPRKTKFDLPHAAAGRASWAKQCTHAGQVGKPNQLSQAGPGVPSPLRATTPVRTHPAQQGAPKVPARLLLAAPVPQVGLHTVQLPVH